MMDVLLEPFAYDYMIRAIWISALVGGVCAFLSCFLMLKGWSLMGDALAHSIVPGVAAAYLMAVPYALGAFIAGGAAASVMAWVKHRTKLREDTIIGLVFTSFFAFGMLLASLNPVAVNIQSIVLGNILTISHQDAVQVSIIAGISFLVLLLVWRNLMLVFFDEAYAKTIGLAVRRYHIIFFTLLSACTISALQTVGACLVISMVITPGASAYLITDRFGKMITIAMAIGISTSAIGAYASYFLDASTGGVIVLFQFIIFATLLFAAPKYGIFAKYNRLKRAANI